MNTAIQSPDAKTYTEADWFIRSLVDRANTSEFEMGITLQVSGLLVSGTLVSGKKYFEGFAEEFIGAIDSPEVAESFKNIFDQYGGLYQNKEGQELPLPQYIHLKNARFFGAIGSIPNKGVWWRGRLSEVSGFILGSLGNNAN